MSATLCFITPIGPSSIPRFICSRNTTHNARMSCSLQTRPHLDLADPVGRKHPHPAATSGDTVGLIRTLCELGWYKASGSTRSGQIDS